MQIEISELSIINVVLQVKIEKSPQTQQDTMVKRTFSGLEDLKLAISIDDKIKVLTQKVVENEIEVEKFIDGEIEFTTQEKNFLLKLLLQPWAKENGKAVISLTEKLS